MFRESLPPKRKEKKSREKKRVNSSNLKTVKTALKTKSNNGSLSVQGLVRKFGKKVAVNDVTFSMDVRSRQDALAGLLNRALHQAVAGRLGHHTQRLRHREAGTD